MVNLTHPLYAFSAWFSTKASLLASRYCRPLAGFLLVLAATSAHAQTAAQYFYDGAGKMTGMLDPSTGSAQYTYDATGNIKAVIRNNLNVVTLLQFSPNAGPVNATITIAGTGFTASGTSVSFNGTNATPTQVTSTSITVAVPSGATTGPLTLTTPSGSATSAASFTVSSTAGPTITSVNPSPVNVGQTLTILGSNFSSGANAGNNKVFINGRFAQVLTATAGKITAQVPNVGSGPVSVETPTGTATGTSTIVVPPQIPWTAATQCSGTQCTYTTNYTNVSSPATLVSAQTVTLPAQGSSVDAPVPAMSFSGSGSPPLALVSFFAQAGQRIAISLPSSLASEDPAGLGISIFGPDGWNPLPESDVPSVTASGHTQTLTTTVTIPMTGTQTIALYFPNLPSLPNYANYCSSINPCSISGNQYALTLYNVPPDVTGTISASVGGTSRTVTFSGSGQSAILTFQQNPAIYAVSVLTAPTLSWVDPQTKCYNVTIQQPELTNQIDLACGSGTNAIDFSNQIATPVPGAYTITLTPLAPLRTANNASTASLTLYSIASAFTPVPITIGGASKTINMAVNGQEGILTFNGTSGQTLTLTTQLQNDTIGQCAQVSVSYMSDQYTQTNVSSAPQCSTSGGTQSFTLPATAAYTITVAPDTVPSNSPPVPALKAVMTLASTSSFASAAPRKTEATPVDVVGTARYGGPPSDLKITAGGQSAEVSFEGFAGQSAEIAVGSDTSFAQKCFFVKTSAPDATPLLDERRCDGSYSSGLLKLPSDGTYHVSVRSADDAIGQIWVHVGQPSFVRGGHS